MKIGNFQRAAAVLAAAACGVASAQQQGGTGPDVAVCLLTGPAFYGTLSGVQAYAIGTTSVNFGTAQLDWFDNSNRHPVIAQNIYRINDGRIRQLGQSYVKHGFCALQLSQCAACTPAGGGCTVRLGLGCSDPYDPTLNGSQGGLGQKADINAATGFFVWPFSQRNQTGNTTFKRIQVAASEVVAGGVYVGEGLYVAADDAASGNDANNSSYRMMIRNSGGSLSFSGNTQVGQPAIMAWQAQDAGVDIQSVDIPGDGVMLLGSKATDLGNGSSRFEYAVQNLTSDRSGGSFSVPLPAGSVVSDVFFSSPAYHSGEPFSNAAWLVDITADSITFRAPQTFAQNANTNALRWGTLYNFGFTVNKGFEPGEVDLGLFKPGTPASVSFSADVPAGPSGCNTADISQEFGVLNANDIIDFVNGFNGQLPIADVSPAGGGDGLFNANDIIDFVNAFNAGCP